MKSRVILLSISIALIASCSNQKSKQVREEYVEHIIFPLQYEHVHGPTVVDLSNGDLLSAWFQGSGERWADDVRIMGSRLESGDTAWSEPFIMADIPGFPDVNPMMFIDPINRLWLMWYPVIANQWETSIPMYRISEDYLSTGSPVWSWQDVLFVKPGDKTERGIQPGDRFVEGVRKQITEYEKYLNDELIASIPEERKDYLLWRWERYKKSLDSLAGGQNMLRRGRLKTIDGEQQTMLGYPLSRRIGWQTKNKPLIISDRIVVPLYSDGLSCSLFALTDDMGKTWQFSNPVVGGVGIQATIASSKDGVLHAYLRDNGPPPKRMQLTKSNDGGLSWSIAKDDILPNPGAGFDITNLHSGEWAIVYNHAEDGRHDLTIAISDDHGESWKWKRQIEFDSRGNEATSSHYPAIIQGSNHLIHVVYSYHHKDRAGEPHKSIKYASFPVSWVKD